MTRQYFLWLDLGQVHDPTALAVLKMEEVERAWDPGRFARRKGAALRLRYLERVPLGTPYPEVVEKVREVTRSAALAGRCRLMVDATGVGRPVVELLRRADLRCGIMPAVVTSGEMETSGDGYYRVPKRDLITGLQVLLQKRALQIAAGLALGPALVKEMTEMRVKVTAAGNEQYGAWREGEHDDLVFAVALACWGARKVCPSVPEAEVRGRIV